MKDLKIILISRDVDYFKDFSAALSDYEFLKIRCITSETGALAAAEKNDVDVVVAAEDVAEGSGLDLIKQVVMKNAFINTVLVSPLPHKDFHEVTEGLGVLMQLPLTPGAEDAENFRQYLAKIY